MSEETREFDNENQAAADQAAEAAADKAAENAADTSDDVVEAEAESIPEGTLVKTETELDPQDIEKEAESICRWGAARASVIVMTPFLGSLALMANEVYMVVRLGDLRGIELESSAITGLISSLGASFVGQTLFTLIPFPPLQVPMGVAITYAVGKAANAWLKAGQPKDMERIREIFEEAKKEGLARFKEFKEDPTRNLPLGDETKLKMKEKARPIFDKIKTTADEAADKVSSTYEDIRNSKEGPKGKVASVMNNVEEVADSVAEKLQPYKEIATRWISVQTWEQLRSGAIVVPYLDLSKGISEALKDSDFKLAGCSYYGDHKLSLSVENEKYGTITAVIGIEGFALNNTASYGRFKIYDFAVADNKLGELVVKLLGTRIIMSLVNAVFNMKTVSKDDLICTYNQNTLTVDFTDVIRKNKVSQYKIADRNLFDVVQLTALVPDEKGIHVCSKWTIKK
ncbi:MAG: hypothetical protein LKE33_03545 [Acidaminococcus sp.]|jgi:uncharacterized protein (DUF697 family)|nr:hypothetical protein [Acidaminococcus sp.]MCI2100501.1 hypothetical protein [Acidaminococcus sp.]MCI2114838.1 hypothetical protein [Acidaminococcus sp.]MCI2116875.1 hypothetical protein [Acidaminococcus sp.]